MKTASVSTLKAHLSRYLRDVRRGDEVVVLDRGVPVARLVTVDPASSTDEDRRRRLIHAGVVRPGTGGCEAILDHRPVQARGADVSEALDEDRKDRA